MLNPILCCIIAQIYIAKSCNAWALSKKYVLLLTKLKTMFVDILKE